MKKIINYFKSQPHQPFFALAVINAVLFMLLFMLSFKAVFTLSINPLTFHAYSLIFLVFTPAFLGFLLTTFPRFSQTPAILQKEYMGIFYALVAGMALFLVGSFFGGFWILLSKVAILLAQAYAMLIFFIIYKASPLKDKHDQFYIMLAWGSGIVSNILFMFDSPATNGSAVLVGVYLYLVFLALSIAQRMVPFFTHVMVDRNQHLLKIVYLLFALFTILELLDLKIGFIALLLSGALLLKEMIRWKLPFNPKEPIIWILHIAIYWLPMALIFGGFAKLAELIFEKSFLSLHIHLVVLGFLTTILIGFGTRVTLGHSGNMMVIGKYTKIVFYLTQIVLYFRIIYSFSGSSMLFDITSALWMGLFLAWGYRYLPVLVSGKRLN
jgi:uncharacterized protein involved in response to NO